MATPAALIKAARLARGWTQQELADRLHRSRSVVSRVESGVQPLRDLELLHALAHALDLPIGRLSGLPTGDVGDDGPVRRRELLSLAVTAAPALALPSLAPATGDPAELLLRSLRDVLLRTRTAPTLPELEPGAGRRWVASLLRAAERHYDAGRLRELAGVLPLLLTAAQQEAVAGDAGPCAVLTRAYLICVRVLVKLERGGGAELGLLAADRARTLAPASGDPVLIAEAARQTAVLVRRTGWQGQAQQIALDAAEDLAGLPGPYAAAQRGLLLQSAAYSAAKAQDAAGMRELTDEAERVAAAVGGAVLLRHHGGGFSRLGVGLHRISGSAAAGDIGQALKAAQAINPAALPTVERRARYWGDVAGVALQAGRPSLCLDALLAAERLAPQEVRARPAVVECARDLLATGRTSPRLRDLADRLGIT